MLIYIQLSYERIRYISLFFLSFHHCSCVTTREKGNLGPIKLLLMYSCSWYMEELGSFLHLVAACYRILTEK